MVPPNLKKKKYIEKPLRGTLCYRKLLGFVTKNQQESRDDQAIESQVSEFSTGSGSQPKNSEREKAVDGEGP